MTVGGTFSGIGGFSLAFERAGFTFAWEVEIDRDARDVLARHFPGARIYEDIREARDLEPVDVVCGGFPCQDLSVAGKRRGLRGERSGLYWELLRVVAELQPRAVVFENVPGLLSSEDGRDMGAVLGGLAELGYGWAYRVLDAQFCGVPQRRERVFIVGCAGGDWRRAAEILFEPESLCRHTPPRRETGESPAGTLGGGAGERGWSPDTDRMTFLPVAGPLCPGGHPGGQAAFSGHAIPVEVAASVTASAGHHGHSSPRGDGSDNLVPIGGFEGSNLGSGGNRGWFGEHEPTPTLTREGIPAVAFQERGREGGRNLEWQEDAAYALTAPNGGGRAHERNVAVAGTECWHIQDQNTGKSLKAKPSPVSTCLGTRDLSTYDGSFNADVIQSDMAVRRLMPIECERLQGFPDSWTATGASGKVMSDGARYRMCGNAVCVPVIEWIARRLYASLEAVL